MKKEMRTLEQLRDSRIMFEKALPPFGYFFIYIILFLLVGLIMWASVTKKPYMIISQGTVTNPESCYVMATYTGEIEKSYMEEGKVVKKGDILFTIKSTEYSLQIEQLQNNKKIYQTQIEKLELLVKSIKDDKNYFDVTEPSDALYYSTFENYKSQVAKNSFDASTYEMYGYSDEQILNEISKKQGEVTEIYYSAIQSAENSIVEANNQIASIDAQLGAIELGQAEYNVEAKEDGVLHMLYDYREGMVVQTGSTIASITPQNAEVIIESYVSTADMARLEIGDSVQITVDGLAKSIYGSISGVVISIDSNVTVLENENTQDNTVFKIIIKPSVDYLISRTGKKVNLCNGMTTQTEIIYDEITYLYYILEKLGISFK